MTVYRYYTISAEGSRKRGTIEAETRERAREILKSRGQTVISIEEAGVLDREITLPFPSPKIKSGDLRVCCRQLAALTEAGVGIYRSFKALEEQAEDAVMKKTFRKISLSLEQGETLAASVEECGNIFPSIFSHLVRAGEESGNLSGAFERMAVCCEKQEKLRNISRKAMIYPMILSAVVLVIIIAMLIYIIPMYGDLFEEMEIELPAGTKAILGIGEFASKYWWVLSAFMFFAAALFFLLRKREAVRETMENMIFRMPVVGSLYKKSNCASFARNLSTLLEAGVPILSALEITEQSVESLKYKKVIRHAGEQVAGGVSLSVLMRDSGIFPAVICHMAGVGEEAGRLDEMMGKAAEYYEEEVTAATEQAAAALEPVIIIVMALIVIFVIAAVFWPLLSLYSGLEYL